MSEKFIDIDDPDDPCPMPRTVEVIPLRKTHEDQFEEWCDQVEQIKKIDPERHYPLVFNLRDFRMRSELCKWNFFSPYNHRNPKEERRVLSIQGKDIPYLQEKISQMDSEVSFSLTHLGPDVIALEIESTQENYCKLYYMDHLNEDPCIKAFEVTRIPL